MDWIIWKEQVGVTRRATIGCQRLSHDSGAPTGVTAPWGGSRSKKVVRRLPEFVFLTSHRRTFLQILARSKTLTIN